MNRIARSIVAALAAAVGLVVPSPPAFAAACTTAAGVSVVVDFNQLGGGVPVVCVPGGGTASSLFTEAGFPLTYAQRQPGFVCRVSGVPTSDPCQNTAPEEAYWGLYWSPGDPGASWTFSSLGVTSLKVPDGGLVAFAWDENPGRELPSAPASRPAPPSEPSASATPKPSPEPTQAATSKPTRSPSPSESPTAATSAPTPVPTGETTEDASTDPSQTPTSTPGDASTSSASPTPSEPATPPPETTSVPEFSEDPVPAAQPRTPDDGGVPAWVGLLVVAVLFIGAGIAIAARRRPRP